MKFLLRLFIISGLFLISSCSYLPDEQIVSDVLQLHETRDYIEITPNWGDHSRTGFVFYPGGLVDAHAYIESLSKFASSGIGHKVIIAKMPGNLAIFDKKQGAYMFEDFPEYNTWVIGGHSLGGVMACEAVKKFPDYFEGLVLMAAYPQNNTDISDWERSVLSIYGNMDMILEQGKIEATAGNLPPSTIFHEISGGNHSYFGKYGIQEGDSEGSISREAQVKETVEQIQKLYDDNGWD